MAMAPKQIGKVFVFGNLVAGGIIGTGVSLETARLINISQTTSAQVLTLAPPVDATALVTVTVANTGTAAFTLYGVPVSAGSTGQYTWGGSAWHPPVQTSAYVGASASGDAAGVAGLIPSAPAGSNSAVLRGSGLYSVEAPTYAAGEWLNPGAVRYFGGATPGVIATNSRGFWRFIASAGVPSVSPGGGVSSFAQWEPVTVASHVSASFGSTQSLASNTATAIDFVGKENFLTSSGDFLWDATNKGLICPTSGVYHFSGEVPLAASIGQMQAWIATAAGPNTFGAVYGADVFAGSAAATCIASVSARMSCQAGQVVGLYALQTSNVALSLTSGGIFSARLSATLLHLS